MSLRVVIVTRIPPVLAGFDAVVREAGHELELLVLQLGVSTDTDPYGS